MRARVGMPACICVCVMYICTYSCTVQYIYRVRGTVCGFMRLQQDESMDEYALYCLCVNDYVWVRIYVHGCVAA